MWRLLPSLFLFYSTTFEVVAGQECGRIRGTARLSGKIVGGYDVGYYKYPWFAALLLDGTPWCGGTLIGENAIVTAAHCFKKYINQHGAKLEDVFTVKLGIYKSCKKEETQKEYKVKTVYIHENYIKKDPYFDIAILILNGDSNNFEPACLPPKVLQDTARGKEAYIIGLGTMNFSQDSYPCDLYEGRVLLYDDKTCKDMIKRTTDDKVDYPMTNAFCAGYKSGGVDACQGDSGGPILIIEPGGRYILLGLTSFGYECAVKDQMGIYTDVSKYLNWIEEKSGVRSKLIQNVATPAVPPPDISSVPTEPQVPASTEKPLNTDGGDGDLSFNPADYLPTYNQPPLVYEEVPDYNNGNNPGYVQQITNGDPYQQIQQWAGNRRPTRIILEYKKRRKYLGHRRRILHRPHRRRLLYRSKTKKNMDDSKDKGGKKRVIKVRRKKNDQKREKSRQQ